MKKIIEIKNSNIRKLRINYDIGNLCNYKCWYCFPDANTGTVKFPDVNIVKKNIVKIINYYLNSGIVDEVHLSLLGGEPTLWKDLGEFVEYVSSHSKCKIYINTNGSRSLRWWKEYCHYFDNISISIHHESVDLDHIESLVKILYEKNACFFTDVLMDHTSWEKCLSILDRLKNSKTKFMVLAKPIHINDQTYYNEDQQQFLQTSLKRYPSIKTLALHWKRFKEISKITAVFSNGETIKIRNEHYFKINLMNRFYGWECNLGVNVLFINRTGELTGSCQQLLYGLPHYLNITDKEFETKFSPKIKPVICEQKVCLCSGEAALTKKQINAPLAQLV